MSPRPLAWIFAATVASSALAMGGVPRPWFLGPLVLVLAVSGVVRLVN